MKSTKIISSLIAAAMMFGGFSSLTYAAENNSTTLTADKTAQWVSDSSESGTYNMRVHGWTGWETAAYMGFTIPENFNLKDVSKADLVLDTTSVKNASEAYIYAADYSAFDNGGQYSGDAPCYTITEIKSFASPASTGEFKIDITDYIKELTDKSNIAFRIDVKSQNTNNDWSIGSCTNGNAPKLVFNAGETIKNPSFSDGDNGWTISDKSNVTVTDGVLKAAGTDYETRISQKVSNLDNGVYTLNAYITNSSMDGISYLYAKTAGHTMASTALPQTTSEMKITVPGIKVEDGNCDIGLYIKGSQTITLDKLSFSKSEETRVPFVKGGEISKLTYIEDMGGKFYREDGTQGDALQIMAENGFNCARIRLLDNPGKGHGDGSYYLPSGYMTLDDCLSLARRAKSKGMQIEFTIAYSDFWVDGEKQMVPSAWQEEITAQNLTGESLVSYLENKVYEYTKTSMQAMINQGTCPEYVSIGNEIQVGILFNTWKNNNGLYNKSEYLARFLNAGAKAVRETAPQTKIVLHSDNGGLVSKRTTFIKILDSVDFDVIGVSYYPFYNSTVSIDNVVNEFNIFITKYNKDVIIMETGYNWSATKPGGWEGQLGDSGYYQEIYGESQEGQRAFLTELYAKLKQVLGGRCIGDLYWDPIMIHDGDTGKIGWAIAESDDCTQANVVPNSTIFDFDGKAVEGQKAMKYNTDTNDKLLVSGNVSENGVPCASKQITVKLNGEICNTVTDNFGDYIAAFDYAKSNTLDISAQGYNEKYTKEIPYDGNLISNINFKSSNNIQRVSAKISDDGIVHCIAEYTGGEGVTFAAALYSENGVLLQMQTNKKDMTFEKVNPNEKYIIKTFLWENNMKPQCEAKGINVIK